MDTDLFQHFSEWQDRLSEQQPKLCRKKQDLKELATQRYAAEGSNMRKWIVNALLLVSFMETNFTVAESTYIDANKAKKAEVVLRVKLVKLEGCNKYCWPEVEILKILQNKSGFSFKKRLAVAYYSWEPGIPEGESTIYLERYNPERNDLWKLLNGSGKDGVSHAIPPRKG